MGTDEPMGEGSEQRPDRWDRHGNENDPFLDLTPAKQNTDTVYEFEYNISNCHRLALGGMQSLLTRRIVTQNKASCPCSHDSCHTSKNTAAHKEAQTPLQLAIDSEWGQHRDRDNGQIEIRECRHGTGEVCVVHTCAMITLTLSQRIPKRVWRGALEPGEQDLWNVENDIEDGDGDQTAADLGVFVKQIRLDYELADFI